jgi:hypothetical protein
MSRFALQYFTKRPIKSSDFEIVIARYNENLHWISSLAHLGYRITVYNKGEPFDTNDVLDNLSVKIIQLPNIGREGDTYAQHIRSRYDSLADYTIFLQGDPFPHSPYLINLLNKPPNTLKNYESFSLKYSEKIPPPNLIKNDETVREQTFSTWTMNSIEFHDAGTVLFWKGYLKFFGLEPGTNVLQHFFDRIGLKHLVPNETKTSLFAYGALFGVSKNTIRRHPLVVYEKIIENVGLDSSIGYILERGWRLLFTQKI